MEKSIIEQQSNVGRKNAGRNIFINGYSPAAIAATRDTGHFSSAKARRPFKERRKPAKAQTKASIKNSLFFFRVILQSFMIHKIE